MTRPTVLHPRLAALLQSAGARPYVVALEPYAVAVSRARRRLLERLGSPRYSRPALFDLDRRLEPYLPERGFFVEAGAYDGYLQSNTYYLEKAKGWRGVLVEAVPEFYEACKRERPAARVFNCALVPPDYGRPTVTVRVGGLMSVVYGAQPSPEADREHARAGTRHGRDPTYDLEVPARTLSAVLDEAQAPDIDLLSLDVEGYEPQALAGLDLSRHAPRFILVEMLEPARTRDAIERLVRDRYDETAQLSPYDYLYRRRERG